MKGVLFFVAALLFCSCEGYDNRLSIKSSLPYDVYVIDYDTSSLNDYPNAQLNTSNDFLESDSIRNIAAFGSSGWPGRVRSARNKKLNLFVIHADTARKYPKDIIIQRKLYCRQLAFSLKQLEQMKWQVEIY
jgi:hypothetical protein